MIPIEDNIKNLPAHKRFTISRLFTSKSTSTKASFYLHIGRIKVDFGKFQNHNVLPILADGYLVAEGTVMVALGLVEYLIDSVNPAYEQLLAVVRVRADLGVNEGIPHVAYAIAVGVGLATAVYRVNHLQAAGCSRQVDQQEQARKQTPDPSFAAVHLIPMQYLQGVSPSCVGAGLS